MIILVDTNIALDFLTMRQPFYNDARKVIRLCASEKVQGYIAFHSLPNIFYILRKSHSDTDRRKMLRKLCMVQRVVGASHERVCSAIERDDFPDFEDCLQDRCAVSVGAKYIITRNTEDFTESQVPAISPESFLNCILTDCGHIC